MELGVKAGRRIDDAEHPNVLRQPDVERPLHGRRGEIDVEVHARHLSQRVHAGVGAPRAGDRRRPATVERRERLFD